MDGIADRQHFLSPCCQAPVGRTTVWPVGDPHPLLDSLQRASCSCSGPPCWQYLTYRCTGCGLPLIASQHSVELGFAQ